MFHNTEYLLFVILKFAPSINPTSRRASPSVSCFDWFLVRGIFLLVAHVGSAKPTVHCWLSGSNKLAHERVTGSNPARGRL